MALKTKEDCLVQAQAALEVAVSVLNKTDGVSPGHGVIAEVAQLSTALTRLAEGWISLSKELE